MCLYYIWFDTILEARRAELGDFLTNFFRSFLEKNGGMKYCSRDFLTLKKDSNQNQILPGYGTIFCGETRQKYILQMEKWQMHWFIK